MKSQSIIKEFKITHKEKYNYSKVHFVNTNTKVEIICPKHGSFFQTPMAHKRGAGCPKCNKSYKLTQEEVLERFKKVHGNKYDYSKVRYNGTMSKVELICHKENHGSFWIKPNNILSRGIGCPKCSKFNLGKKRIKSQEKVIKEFKITHNEKYDYSKVLYKNTNTKVEIICPKHGSFFQTPMAHKRGAGCPKCSGMNKTTEEILKEFKKAHNNKYNYSRVNYIDSSTKVEIICPEHGSFWQLSNNHKNGQGCPKCGYKIKKKKNLKEYLKDFKEIHKGKYNYSKVNYINSNTKVEIICPEHGSFWQAPTIHRLGVSCPICARESSETKGEKRIREFLESNNISYEQEVKLFKNYRFDFYLEELNTVIEFDGRQHFEKDNYFGGEEGFIKTQERDNKKNNFCDENNINLIRIPYWDFKNIEKILKEKILKEPKELKELE